MAPTEHQNTPYSKSGVYVKNQFVVDMIMGDSNGGSQLHFVARSFLAKRVVELRKFLVARVKRGRQFYGHTKGAKYCVGTKRSIEDQHELHSNSA